MISWMIYYVKSPYTEIICSSSRSGDLTEMWEEATGEVLTGRHSAVMGGWILGNAQGQQKENNHAIALGMQSDCNMALFHAFRLVKDIPQCSRFQGFHRQNLKCSHRLSGVGNSEIIHHGILLSMLHCPNLLIQNS